VVDDLIERLRASGCDVLERLLPIPIVPAQGGAVSGGTGGVGGADDGGSDAAGGGGSSEGGGAGDAAGGAESGSVAGATAADGGGSSTAGAGGAKRVRLAALVFAVVTGFAVRGFFASASSSALSVLTCLRSFFAARRVSLNFCRACR
jgi:hypothetical protein